MEKQVWVARNPGGKRLFAFHSKPVWDGRWVSKDGRWIELPPAWVAEPVTFENSPRRLRSVRLHRKQ